jgi:hypothetical protein
MKLEEILKARGYADADLAALAPLLADQKLRGALETQIAEMEGQLTSAKQENQSWADWHKDTALPTIEKALKDAQDASADAAAQRARLKTLQDQGLIKVAEGEGELVKKPPESEFDPSKYNLVTRADVTAFADAEGHAIAMAQDLAAEYFELYGKPLSGFRDLRKEAIASKVPVDQFVANKFKFAEKRAERDAAERKKQDDAIRADERAKTIAEVANPNARPPSASNHPFIVRPAGTEAGKQPWDNPEQRTQERVNKALKTALSA